MGREVVLIMAPSTPKPPAAAAKPAAKPVPKGKAAPAVKGKTGARPEPKTRLSVTDRLFWFLRDVAPRQNMIVNEKAEIAKYRRLVTMVNVQAVAIGLLAIIIIMGAPVVQIVYRYHAANPHHDVRDLVPLTGPNLTNDAVLSWATKGVVEILTLGFGDFDHQILSQYSRFTPEGWASFTQAIRSMGLRATFKEKQLVLTTVPRDAAVIVGQGENADQEYEWHIEAPIIMTYTTNNNVSERQRALVRLTLVRVPSSQNSSGIGIKQWLLN